MKGELSTLEEEQTRHMDQQDETVNEIQETVHREVTQRDKKAYCRYSAGYSDIHDRVKVIVNCLTEK